MDCRPARRALVRPQLDRVRPERKRTRCPRRWRWRAIQGSDRLGIAPQCLVTERDLLQSIKVSRIQLRRALQIAQPFLLLAAPPQDVAGEFEETRIIG